MLPQYHSQKEVMVLHFRHFMFLVEFLLTQLVLAAVCSVLANVQSYYSFLELDDMPSPYCMDEMLTSLY